MSKSRGGLQGRTAKVKAGRLDGEDRRSARLACFERAVRLCGVAEREALIDVDPDFPAFDHPEQPGGSRFELGAPGDVAEQRRPGEEQGSLLREQERRDRFDRTRRIAEAHHQSARGEAIERLQEGVAADGIIDDRQLLAGRDPLDLGDEILPGVDDRMIAAVGARERGLLVV